MSITYYVKPYCMLYRCTIRILCLLYHYTSQYYTVSHSPQCIIMYQTIPYYTMYYISILIQTEIGFSYLIVSYITLVFAVYILVDSAAVDHTAFTLTTTVSPSVFPFSTGQHFLNNIFIWPHYCDHIGEQKVGKARADNPKSSQRSLLGTNYIHLIWKKGHFVSLNALHIDFTFIWLRCYPKQIGCCTEALIWSGTLLLCL